MIHPSSKSANRTATRSEGIWTMWAALLLISITPVSGFATQQIVPDGWELIAHYPLEEDAEDLTGNYGPFKLENAPFADSALFLNGVYPSGPGVLGYAARSPRIDAMDLAEVAVLVEFKTDSLQGSPVVNGGSSYRWATAYLRVDSLVHLSVNNHARSFLSATPWQTGKWHELGFVVSEGTVSLWLDGVRGVYESVSTLDTGDDKTITFNDPGGGHAFFGSVRNLRIYSKASVGTSLREFGVVPEKLPVLVDVYPNPADRSSRLLVTGGEGRSASVSMFDILGRRVGRTLRLGTGRSESQIALGELAGQEELTPGLYLLRVTTGESVATLAIPVME